MSITPDPSLPGDPVPDGLRDDLPGDVKDDWNAAVAPGPTIKVAELPFSHSYPVDDHVVGTGGAIETVTMTGVLTVR